MIYVLEVEDRRWVKIGYTGQDDVAKRIAQLQTGNPYEIRPVMTVDGSLSDEQALHGALREAFLRLHLRPAMNEWYPGRHQFMRQVILELRFGPRVAEAFADAYADNKVGLRNGDLVLPKKERDQLRKAAAKLPEHSAARTISLRAVRRSEQLETNRPRESAVQHPHSASRHSGKVRLAPAVGCPKGAAEQAAAKQ